MSPPSYLGAFTATAIPVALVYVIIGVSFAIWRERPAAVLWAMATFAAVMVPLLLLTGALAFLMPQLMPTPLSRALIVGIWFWAGATEVESQFPSLAASVLSLTMDYPQHVFFGSRDAAGPFQGAALNVLRPEATVGTALLSLALILGMAAVILTAPSGLRLRASE